MVPEAKTTRGKLRLQIPTRNMMTTATNKKLRTDLCAAINSRRIGNDTMVFIKSSCLRSSRYRQALLPELFFLFGYAASSGEPKRRQAASSFRRLPDLPAGRSGTKLRG